MGFLGKALSPVTGLVGGQGGAKNLLFGKKDTGTPDRFVDLDPEVKKSQDLAREKQTQGLKSLTEMGAENTGQLIANEQRRNRGAFEDAQRNLQSQIAQRGLGNSSIGLSQLSNLSQNYALNQADVANNIMAGLRDRERQRYLQDLQAANSVLSNAGLQRTFVQGQQGTGQRGGGLFGLGATIAGTAIGAKAGGAQGAAMGSQLGSTLGTGLSNLGS